MIIKNPPKLTNRSSVIKYLEIDLWSWLRELANGTVRWNFQENFQSFEVTNLTILAGQQVAIPNQFKTSDPGAIPTHRIITRQQGDANIIDGTTEWSSSFLYLYNPSGNNAIVSVIFFK
jgi:hypothetical protein